MFPLHACLKTVGLIAMVFVLAGCGQTGELTLPPEKGSETAPEATPENSGEYTEDENAQ